MSRYCPDCGAPRATGATTCPICGMSEAAVLSAGFATPQSSASLVRAKDRVAVGPFSAARNVPTVRRPHLGFGRRSAIVASCILLLALALLCLGLLGIFLQSSGTALLSVKEADIQIALPLALIAPEHYSARGALTRLGKNA